LAIAGRYICTGLSLNLAELQVFVADAEPAR
jgi:hypothetical protein